MHAVGSHTITLMRQRPVRRFAIWIVIALLFTQWATAVYACPRATSAAAEVAMVSMTDCGEGMPRAAMDADRPLLCQAHCDHGVQTVNDPPPQQPPPQPPAFLWAVLDWNVAAPARLDLGLAPAEHPAVARPSTAPPVYLLLHVFRN